MPTLRLLGATVALLIAAASPNAQHVSIEQTSSGDYVGVFEVDAVVPVSPDLPVSWNSLDNIYPSGDVAGLESILNVATERHSQDRFEWWKKPVQLTGYIDNSCADATINLHDATLQQGALPEGWQIRWVGTLGSLTTAENALFEDYGSLFQWYGSGQFEDPEFNALDPPSYAHSLNVVRSPDGNYYTIDTWDDDVELKRVYPIDDDATFFSENPNETDLSQSRYRLAAVDSERGRPWDAPFVGPPAPDPPQQMECEPPPSDDEVEVEVLTSADPNDKYGLLGSGSERYITPDERFYYTIRFENMPDASAPAQEVLVRDTLDASVLDLSTFQLGDIQFGSTRVRVPPGLTSYTTQVAIESPFVVVISASLVPATGIVTWRFTTLDTNTNDLPFDPLDGFLPPNQNPPEGEGSVSFTIRAKEDLANGTVIRNQARIIFDLNEPIDTPPWVNTIDTAPPMSGVLALSETQSDSVFTVTWGGSDGGSGVGAWDVYVSVDGGAFYQWLRRVPPLVTEETFVGRDGSTYAFYSIATDATGNTEGPKTEAEAVTGVAVSSEGPASGLPLAVELAAPFPNPASAGRTIDVPFALPEAQAADLRVYDVRGREVARLSEGERPAGWHRVEWATRDLAPGVYILRLQTESRVQTRRITVVR